jgi:hypothetical protein
MSYSKRIICLANSRKPSGKCVAGKEIVDAKAGPWIRPVSSRSTHEISLAEQRYPNGSYPQLLDIADVTFLAPSPSAHQTENHRIDSRVRWEQKGRLAFEDLPSLLDNPPTLWKNGESTKAGLNDRVSTSSASKLTSSLVLIALEKLTLRVSTDGAFFGRPRKRVRAEFCYKGIWYVLLATDPAIEAIYRAKPDGDYDLAECYLCVSLAEAHTDNYCYKVVAAIIHK